MLKPTDIPKGQTACLLGRTQRDGKLQALSSIVIGSRLAPSVKRGYMEPMQPDGGMPELLKRQIDRLETAIDLSTDWLEIQYLMVELDQLKALYEDTESEAA